MNDRWTGAPLAAHDDDPLETQEWTDALRAVVRHRGPARARELMDRLAVLARSEAIGWRPARTTPYLNTVPLAEQPPYPGDLGLEQRLASLMRWNAMAMVMRANQAHADLGGHLASYASAADLFEVGFNHFFRASASGQAGDLVFFQAHSAPGVYARAFLEGRLEEADLRHYRQEILAQENGAQGLSSYPHPWLMPRFWQFPTGSMGIGPISSIYQARFMRYLAHRGLLDTGGRRVWGVFGDGEMDEPESMSALTLAAREGLDNLVWVVNCNLQRLDGPVRGNGRIIDELEALFDGAGWNVVKLVWGSDWDALFARDTAGALAEAFARTVDGQFQTFAANDGAYNRARFFGQDPRLAALVAHLSDADIDALRRGGHDFAKIHAAYDRALRHRGGPTVVLAHTKKGFGLGPGGQGRMTTHQHKKLDRAALLEFRDRFQLPLSDEEAAGLAFCRPAADSREARYLAERRERLGGWLPVRNPAAPALPVPPLAAWAGFALDAGGKEMSTTLAFVRLLGALLKDPVLGPRIVPIVADEARTFGMAAMFKQVGIYSSVGQRYEPEDIGSVLSYREALDGQILEEGISEAGAVSSWVAAATSYAVHGLPMLPFYIYYSMFGFQRVGDLLWAAADQRPRGFLVGATSGRTTLGGEGLQHQDGSSLLAAATIPNCRAWDPATAGELAVIVEHGLRQMLEHQDDVFHYVTVTNESYAQPSLDAAVHADVLRGMRRVRAGGPAAGEAVQLLASGAILNEALRAADTLASLGVAAEVFSVTSWSELARDGMACERAARLGAAARTPHVARLLGPGRGPVIAASDWVRAVPEQLRAFVASPDQPRRYVVLGTDGFGRSDTRSRLRRFFEVDAQAIVEAALHALGRDPLASTCAAPPWER